MSEYFTEEEIGMAKEHMKNFSTSFVTRKMPNDT